MNNYLASRERYKVAYHSWDAAARRLCDLFGCSFADLEQRLLEARASGRHHEEIAHYARLSNALDMASDEWDRAQQQILRRDISLIDC